MENGKKRVKNTVLSLNWSLIPTTTLTWKAKLSESDINDSWWQVHLFYSVEQVSSCSIAAQLLFPLLAPEGQFRGRPTLMMTTFLTAARSCNIGGLCENNIFFLFSFSPPPIFPFQENKVHCASFTEDCGKASCNSYCKKTPLYFRWKCIKKFEDMHKTVLLF